MRFNRKPKPGLNAISLLHSNAYFFTSTVSLQRRECARIRKKESTTHKCLLSNQKINFPCRKISHHGFVSIFVNPWLYIIYCIANILHKRIAQFSSTFHSIQSRSSNKSFEREREKETQKQPKIDIDFWSLLIFRICENLVRNKKNYRNSIDGRRSDYVAGVCIHWVFADFTN